ncbi:MAG: dihydroorotate dehydrogenase electron transfer subunit [Patescibacteria group bacterium]
MNIEQPKVIPIKKIIEENSTVRTFYFDLDLKAKPGQFIMLWLPRVNLKPFGVSYQKDGLTGVTICKVGPATEKIFQLKPGDLVGIQGPYGTHYQTNGIKNLVLVAGGYGAAPLSFLAEENLDKNIDLIIGAQCQEKLLFAERFAKTKIKLHQCTDDGSCGFKGFTTTKLEEIIKIKKVDLVCACGPELMQEKVIEICGRHQIPCQISLERYIKCGIGLCGQCVVDPLGIRMCKEGPVISAELVKKIYEFGQYHRDATGKKIFFKI